MTDELMHHPHGHAQYQYHRRTFAAMHDWEHTEQAIVDFTEESGPSGLLGLDQMGHFGPHGCDLVVEAICSVAPGSPVTICEMGSGFGGALRYIVDRLGVGGVDVARAFGVDLVPEHCAVSRRITAEQGRTNVREICASAGRIPLPDRTLDTVMVTGSMPHFPHPAEVLAEAARLLRPGGLLVLTEEVSLTNGTQEPSSAFREMHPRGVFFTTPVDKRQEQLTTAGFVDVSVRPLTAWATTLIEERLKAARIFRGTVERIYGKEPTEIIQKTLTTTRDEYAAGRLVPMLVTASTPVT